MLLVGGGDKPSGAQIYDPAVSKWTSAGHMMIDRTDHTATLLKDGRVLIIGGRSSIPIVSGHPNYAVGSAEIYRPSDGGR